MPSIEAFRFDQSVADVFQDMIERSVPGYGLVLQLIGVLAEKYGQQDTRAYDLGCSLGASTLQLRRHLPDGCHVIGVDNSEAMVSRCKANLSRDNSAATYEILLEDLRETNIQNASIVILNFTLQFVPDEQRKNILTHIFEGLNSGGILLLAEKVKFEDPAEQALMTTLHHDFKKQHGYSHLEISQKRAALENVLLPNTEKQHRQRMRDAGFSVVEQCMRCLNFSTFLGIK
jgi:tRNA (cmo5U34)-methyltransferase|tara:strand:+ start:363 stop:1055 length:693 start_codon:yes stop_codon:yes gene_type:complete